MKTADDRPLYGIAAEFASADALLNAAKALRDAGYTRWDVFSPYPIHGMDRAMGLRNSPLGKVVFVAGLLGCLAAAAMQFFPSAVFYQVIAGGRGSGAASAPAFVPIVFEVAILASAVAAFFGFFALSGLPRLNHPLFNWEKFSTVSRDAFFAAVEATDPRFCEVESARLLEALGGSNITLIHGD